MRYVVAADTDIGISRKTNQDSICVKTADSKFGSAALVLVCDGMGGLSKGELASATVIRSFSDWFDRDIQFELESRDMNKIAASVTERIRTLNEKLVEYGRKNKVQLGTTATGMLVFDDQYMIFHIGDTRIYTISDKLVLLTEDHTFINRELKKGSITPEEAKTHPKRNALVQCIGVSGNANPDIKLGTLQKNANYLFCTDGFRHVITPKEIYENFSGSLSKNDMQKKLRELIELVKSRNERDNISAVIFRGETA